MEAVTWHCFFWCFFFCSFFLTIFLNTLMINDYLQEFMYKDNAWANDVGMMGMVRGKDACG